MNDAALPIRYDAMLHAIAECHRIDEAKDIRDKARAMEVYARQALNLDAERQCAEIRLRAERRAGELLRETAISGERETRGGDRKSNSRDSSLKLADIGLSDNQSSQFQKLAAVPPDQFEAALKAPGIPSTAAIIASHEARARPKEQPAAVSREALWLWGRLCDFEADGFLDSDLGALLDEMQPHMRADCARVIPRLIDWLKRGAQ